MLLKYKTDALLYSKSLIYTKADSKDNLTLNTIFSEYIEYHQLKMDYVIARGSQNFANTFFPSVDTCTCNLDLQIGFAVLANKNDLSNIFFIQKVGEDLLMTCDTRKNSL